jgi:hypothetical protein
VAEAEDILQGKYRLFSNRITHAGDLPDWSLNQLTGERASVDSHWTKLGGPSAGDIKGVWELSRFPWAFALARAHTRTGEMRYAEVFWQLFIDWSRCNPPNSGPNWMCGQEATFRLMAVVFAANAVGVPEAARVVVSRFAVATGRRIAANLDYALSQKNNHGVSECTGLITVALMLPQHDESPQWLARGLRELERQLAELVYPDGSFSQHSLIYHRVLLHDLSWCAARLRSAGRDTPSWLTVAAERALSFLMQITDPHTGRAPLFGSNDGAYVLPLADGDFQDMRPTIQMASAIFCGILHLPEGPWDEAAAWLTGSLSGLCRVDWPKPAIFWHWETGGYAQLNSGEDRLFFRCPAHFLHRPSQADMLHVDIWQQGHPIAEDGGSFSYNSTERFTALSEAAYHNTLTLDGIEPLQKFSRFLYMPWVCGHVEKLSNNRIRASHDGYAKLGVHWTREVSLRPGGGFSILDRITGANGHRLVWHWRLADTSWLKNPNANSVKIISTERRYEVRWGPLPGMRSNLLTADPTTAYGWVSPYYEAVQPACSLLVEVEASGDIELLTEFCPLN